MVRRNDHELLPYNPGNFSGLAVFGNISETWLSILNINWKSPHRRFLVGGLKLGYSLHLVWQCLAAQM